MESDLKTTSHKGKKVRCYNVDFKREVIQYATFYSIPAAAKIYKVDHKGIRHWIKIKEKLTELKHVKPGGSKRQRLDGGG